MEGNATLPYQRGYLLLCPNPSTNCLKPMFQSTTHFVFHLVGKNILCVTNLLNLVLPIYFSNLVLCKAMNREDGPTHSNVLVEEGF